MCFFVENWIPVSKLGWETRHTVKFGLFWGPLFTWDFSNIGSIFKKKSALGKNPSRQAFFVKEAEKNPSETLYRCQFAWRIGFQCRNWGEKPGTRSNLGFFEDHFSPEIFSIIGSIVKKFWAPDKIRPASHFLWRKPKKTLPRPFIDVIFRRESDSGVEIGVGNPAHGQIWAFLGTTFHLRFFQHTVNF